MQPALAKLKHIHECLVRACASCVTHMFEEDDRQGQSSEPCADLEGMAQGVRTPHPGKSQKYSINGPDPLKTQSYQKVSEYDQEIP